MVPRPGAPLIPSRVSSSGRGTTVRLTVVVATFNRARLVAQLLEALDAQVVPDGMAWDVVVVDNNSTDATRSTVEASRDTMRVPVTYLFEPRQGKSFALNTGIEHAKGDIIAFTDDDVIPAADWIATVVRSMREWQADIIGGRILPKWGGTVPPWLKKNGEFHARLALLEHVTAKRLTSPHGVPGVWGANMAVARDLFDRIGRFDIRLGPMGTKLYRSGEELDLVRRALSEGRTVVYDPRLVVWHQIGPDRLRRSYFRRYYFQRAEGEALVKDRRSRFTVFGAAPYHYRHAILSLAGWIGTVCCSRRDAFERELALFAAAGRLWGHWLAYFKRASLFP